MTVAVLFTMKDSVYETIPGVDCWPLQRNALNYRGPYRVIAHPPCSRWGNYATKGDRLVGDDDNCFAHALWSVRTFGGIIEHPANSKAWDWFGIAKPTRPGWARADMWGYTCCVEQGNYGHVARKATWLYASSIKLHELTWKSSENKHSPVMDISQQEREATPVAFAEALVAMASQ